MQSWPPDEWTELYNLYEEWDAWYSGDPIRLSKVYQSKVYTPTPNGAFWAKEIGEERRVMLHVPIAGDISQTSADMLFSESPKVRIPEANQENAPMDAIATQERLEELTQLTGFYNKILEAAETCSALGGIFLKVDWDSEFKDFPILSVVQTDNAIPKFRFGFLYEVTFHKIVDGDDATVYRLLETRQKGRIVNELYEGTISELGEKVPLDTLEATADLKDEINTGIDDMLVRYIPNMRPNRRYRGSSIGQSDYSGSEGLMDALDEVYTSWMRDIRLARGRIHVPETYLKTDERGNKVFDIDKEVYVVFEQDPLTAKEKGGITPVQFGIRTQEHRDTALELLDRIISNSGYSPQSFGLKIEGRAESGTALNIRERKSFVTTAKKAKYWKPALEDILHLMLVVDKQQLSTRNISTDYKPSVEIQDSIQTDIGQIATSVEMLNRARAVSIDTKVRMLHEDWTEEQIQQEVEKIKAEEGLNVQDPTGAGII